MSDSGEEKSDRLLPLLVLAAVVASIAVGYGQIAFHWGMSPRDFSAQGDGVIRAAPYAFSIWGVIYLYLLVYGVYQLLPRTRPSPLLNLLGWPSLTALLGITAWIVAAAANAQWVSVFLIFLSALVLITPMLSRPGVISGAGLRRRMLIAWPLALLAGWLSIASILNLITVLTAQGIAPGSIPRVVWAAAGMIIAAVVAVGFAAWTRLWIFAVPVAWGLVGVFSASEVDNEPFTAILALGLAFAVAVMTALTLVRVATKKKAATPDQTAPSPPSEI